METSDTLLSLAELAIALAGFSSLFSVLDRSLDPQARSRARSDLQIMLEIGLRNATFAGIPLPLIASGFAGPSLWRWLSGLYLVAMLGHIQYQRSRSDHRILSQTSDLRPVLIGVTLASALISAANVVGLAERHAFSLYLASLILGLVFAGLLFVAVARRVTWEDR